MTAPPPSAPPPPTASPHRLGRYFLHTRLAVGGMAEVWLARQEGPVGFTKDLVVKKILPHLAEDRTFVQMFLDEARLAAHLNHPNVVQIFELGEEAGVYYLVMEYIHGRNLRAVQRKLKEKSQLVPHGILCQMLVGACEGLHYAHEARDASGTALNLVHRDVSPDNVLVSFEGQPKVVDFGIAKAATSSGTTRTGTLKGKYAYMSPEQALGEPVDRRADVYSMGIVLYELLAGMRPFHSQSELAMLNAIVKDPPPPIQSVRPEVPAALARIVEKSISKSRDARQPDARSLGLELDAWQRAHAPTNIVDVASFMELHFAEERAAIRAIGLQLTPAPGLPLPGDVKRESATIASPPPTMPPPGRSKAAMIVGGVTGAAVLAAGAWFLGRSPPATPLASAGLDAASVAASAGPDASSAPTPPEPVAGPDASTAAPSEVEVPDAGQARAATSRKGGKGRITVRVNPWAEVTVDGKKIGVTPVPPIELPEGRHTVVLENSELAARREIQVNVKAGRDTPVLVDLFE